MIRPLIPRLEFAQRPAQRFPRTFSALRLRHRRHDGDAERGRARRPPPARAAAAVNFVDHG